MIHGLWPQYNKTTYPEYCKNVSYHTPQGILLENMEEYWYSSCDDDSDTLWKHEWEKHGSCVNDTSEDDYFEKTIELFKNNLDLLSHCTDENCILGCFDINYKKMDC